MDLKPALLALAAVLQFGTLVVAALIFRWIRRRALWVPVFVTVGGIFLLDVATLVDHWGADRTDLDAPTVIGLMVAVGALVGMTIMSRYLRQQQEAEEGRDRERDVARRALEEHHASLERAVAERTAELTETLRLLEEATEARDRFMASMSHELRTPLNSIIGYTRVLLAGMAGDLSEEQRLQLGMVDASATRLWAMLREMLEVIDLDRGEVPVDIAGFTAGDALLEASRWALPAARVKGLELHTVLPDREIDLIGDREKVVECLGLLLDNAVKFTAHGSVSMHAEWDGDGEVVFAVADTGIGMSTDAVHTVHETFEQINAADGMKPSGAGMGLPLCTRLAALMHGTLQVDSAEGRGSTFRLVVPRRLDVQA